MLEFVKKDTELILIYTPDYGMDEILKRIKLYEGHNIKNIFWAEKKLLRELVDCEGDSICFSIGEVQGGYIEIYHDVVDTKHLS